MIRLAGKHEDLIAAADQGWTIQWRKANLKGDPDWSGYPVEEGTGEAAIEVMRNNPDDYEFRLKADAQTDSLSERPDPAVEAERKRAQHRRFEQRQRLP